MTQKAKIPPFRAKHLRPRHQKRERVELEQRVTADGRRYMEAPPPIEAKRPFNWAASVGK